MAIWAADVCPRAARQLIGLCIEPRGLRLRHIGRTDPQCGTVQFCFRSGRQTCSARTGFRASPRPWEMLYYCPLADLGDAFGKKMALLNTWKITARRRTSLWYSTIMNDGNNQEANYQSQNDFSSAHRCASPAHWRTTQVDVVS